MKRLERVVKISTIDNGYLLEFHERRDDQEQHHLRSYSDLGELEKELASMTSEVLISDRKVLFN